MGSKRERSRAPFVFSIQVLFSEALLTRSCLHAVVRFADVQHVLFALEAGLVKRVTAVPVWLPHRSIGRVRGAHIHELCRDLGDSLLALEDADLNVGTRSLPLKLVFAGRNRCSVYVVGMVQT